MRAAFNSTTTADYRISFTSQSIQGCTTLRLTASCQTAHDTCKSMD